MERKPGLPAKLSALYCLSTLLLAALSAGAATQPPVRVQAEGQSLPRFAPSTAPVTVAEIVRRFESLESTMTALTADFQQSVRLEETGGTSSVLGTVDYLKPRSLRIEHSSPNRQTIVSDGKSLWVYRHENNQAIQAGLDDWKKSEPVASTLLDFGSYSALLKRYDVSIDSVSAPAADGHREAAVLLRPRQAGADFSLLLRLNTRDFFPAQAELKAGRILITTRFSKVLLNRPRPPGYFSFTPPDGADIFTNFKPPVFQ